MIFTLRLLCTDISSCRELSDVIKIVLAKRLNRNEKATKLGLLNASIAEKQKIRDVLFSVQKSLNEDFTNYSLRAVDQSDTSESGAFALTTSLLTKARAVKREADKIDGWLVKPFSLPCSSSRY